MEIREIFDTIESDSNMDEELQRDILEKIDNIARADKLVDGLEEKIEEHKDELSEKELKYIINKLYNILRRNLTWAKFKQNWRH